MKELTKAEEEIMHVLWHLEAGFVKDLIDQLPNPKPAYNTVSTLVRILQKKGFVAHEIHGKSHKYHPLISKAEYTKSYMKGFVKRYFSGSYQQMISFFTKEDSLSLQDLEQLIKELKEPGK